MVVGIITVMDWFGFHFGNIDYGCHVGYDKEIDFQKKIIKIFMYKSYKISKRFGIAFNKFRKSAKEISKVYRTGFHKWTDEINEFTTYSITVGVYRVMLYVEHKHKCGATNG